MLAFLARRAAAAGFVLFCLSVLVFLLFFATPGVDPAARFAGRGASPETLRQVREALGLDDPLPMRYVHLMDSLLVEQDLASYASPGLLVAPQIAKAVPVTLSLVLGATAVWWLLALALGMLSAVRRGGALDPLLNVASVVALSIPVYWLGAVTLLLTQGSLRRNGFSWLPPPGYVPLTSAPGQWFLHLALPWAVLGLAYAGISARLLRNSLGDALGAPHVTAARARGVPPGRLLTRHALRGALRPVLPQVGLDLGALLGGGTLLTEVAFGLPGVGRLTYEGLQQLDLPVILGCVLLYALLVVTVNAGVDLLQAWLDPRVRL
ncbi:ABC transporter permease [Motilibacter aurantiacus]|uniref:ABC transporter permease n=1 Tax=Motilibacter aurantiacus TaxID=2714955 RepID=UPI00140BC415|nr:ABC transporter permease [Motilibacter aurantiacus]NHC47639.1 ABC transporter permease [Motilibacter aurantiacus]